MQRMHQTTSVCSRLDSDEEFESCLAVHSLIRTISSSVYVGYTNAADVSNSYGDG